MFFYAENVLEYTSYYSLGCVRDHHRRDDDIDNHNQVLNVILLLSITLTGKHRRRCTHACSTTLPLMNSLVVQAYDQQRPLSIFFVLRLITKSSLSSVGDNNSLTKNQTIEVVLNIIQNCSLGTKEGCIVMLFSISDMTSEYQELRDKITRTNYEDDRLPHVC